MSKLNKDILFLLFEELQDDLKSLFSCLMVSRLWCETVIPVLWKNPWNYNINYYNKSSLYYIITFYLSDDIKESLTRLGIQFPPFSLNSLLFDYLSLCRSINMNVINNIISVGSPLAYNQFLFQQEIYKLFIRKCPEFKYLDMRSIQHQIFYFPEANIHLNSICELKCNKSTDSTYFYGLAHACQNIQRLIIINTDTNSNHGIVKLIKLQKNLKYFEWQDSFRNDYFMGDPYKEIFLALAEKADTLNHFIVSFQEIYDHYNYLFLQELLPKLYKLKTFKFSPSYLNGCDFENQLKLLVYRDLEIFNMDNIGFKPITCIIENSRGHLREILTNYESEYDDCYYDNSLILIGTIYQKCPLVEYLSLEFPLTNGHLIEFEKLLKDCQKLKVLLLFVLNDKMDGDELLRILIRSASKNLREIRFVNNINLLFSLKTLKEFLEKWKGRHILSILTSAPVNNGDNHIKLINKYEDDGVIDFKYVDDIYF